MAGFNFAQNIIGLKNAGGGGGGSSKYEFKEVNVPSTSLHVDYYGYNNFNTGVDIAEDDVICGYAPKFTSHERFIVVNCYRDTTTGKAFLRVYNPNGYEFTGTGAVIGTIITRK